MLSAVALRRGRLCSLLERLLLPTPTPSSCTPRTAGFSKLSCHSFVMSNAGPFLPLEPSLLHWILAFLCPSCEAATSPPFVLSTCCLQGCRLGWSEICDRVADFGCHRENVFEAWLSSQHTGGGLGASRGADR